MKRASKSFPSLLTLSGTIGLGNIAGCTCNFSSRAWLNFWMWVTAIIGIATKFYLHFVSDVSRKTKQGEIFGGPMYVIKMVFQKECYLACFFALAGMIGCLPAFQSNQLIQITGDLAFQKLKILIFGRLSPRRYYWISGNWWFKKNS